MTVATVSLVLIFTAVAEVLTVHERKPVCSLRIEVRRQDDEVVLEGEAWCYRFMPPGSSGHDEESTK